MNWPQRDLAVTWHPFTQMAAWRPLCIERGEGNYLFDSEGRRYFDGVSSLWCNVHGHGHPRLTRALVEQAQKLAHSTFLGLTHPPAIELAELLVRCSPSGLTRVFYSDSGSTAVEVALKQSFQYWQLRGKPKKQKFIRLAEAYHGDTLGAVGVGGISLFHRIFGPLLVDSIAISSPFRPLVRGEAIGSGRLHDQVKALRELDEVLTRADEIAAMIVEPLVQGAAGMLVHPAGFLAEVAKRCRNAGVHLIVDEVATGFGRTGKMFACEHEDVSPDFLCVAKGLAGGYLPLAATLSTEEIYNAFLGERSEYRQFFHGHTFTANPIACAVGVESIRMLTEHGQSYLDRFGRCVTDAAYALAGHPNVIDVRGIGGMFGIEVGEHGLPAAAAQFVGAAVCEVARKHGVLLRPLGDTIVWMPPISSSAEEVAELARVTGKSITEAFNRL